MHRSRHHLWAVFLAIAMNSFVFSITAGQEKVAPPKSAVDISELVGDTSVIQESQKLADDALSLIAKINSEETNDKTQYIDELRTIRVKITKRTPVLRTLLDNMRRTKESLKVPIFDSFPSALDQPNEAISNSNLEHIDIQRTIEILSVELAEKKKQSAPATEIAKLEADLNAFKRRLEADADRRAEEKKKLDEQEKLIQERNRRRIALLEQRNLQAKEIDAVITVGDAAARNLDEALNILDDLSGSLLQANAEGAAYTDKATLVFAVLVGGVIIGFFVVAFTSNTVKTAIFAGDSGIQFVTMFSLVIAIILFGVLKILEGRELAALLGGLSGYILGRGSRGDRGARTPTDPQPVKPPEPAPRAVEG